MIVAPLVGGLANQLVIYAAAKSLAKNNSDQVFVDLAYFKRKSSFPFRFNEISIDYKEVANKDLYNKFGILRIDVNRFTRLACNYLFKGRNVYNEPFLTYDKNFFSQEGDIYLRGDFVSIKYYFSILAELKKEFAPRYISQRAIELISKIKNENSVSIHVRRGDYVSNENANNFHGLLGKEYYKTAVNIVKSRISNPVFYVFSDDIERVRKELDFFEDMNVIFVSEQKGLNDIDELEMMKSAKCNIIANSGFSRWAGLLNYNDSPLVIMPNRWFKAYDIETSDIGLPTWVRIDSFFL